MVSSSSSPTAAGSRRTDPTRPRAPVGWVPIRSLAPRHRAKIAEHLLALGPEDRYLRFGYPAGDDQIRRYVDQIDFERDEVFGIFNRRLDVIAMAHLAYLPVPTGSDTRAAEFGVSVLQRARGRGWGSRLFERAVLHARNRHVDTLVIHALAENASMLRIVRRAGATVDFEGGDAVARLRLPPEDLASHVEALVEHGAAELDYGWKLHARRVHDWLRLFDSPPGATPEVRADDGPRITHTRDRDVPPAV